MPIVRQIPPLGLLAALALTYFGPLALAPGRTLNADHSDLIALHVPLAEFLARSWRLDGEAPLWNPTQFSGLPFAHDVQAAISYPPHAIFRVVDPRAVGPALSWLLVAHVVWAGWGMYAYARATGLGVTASVVAAVGLMFAGKWLLHLVLAGHYAFNGLAWLPWAMLGLHLAFEGRSRWLGATWSGVALGMMALGTHPQLTLYSAAFLMIWTFPFAFDANLSTYRGVGLWLGTLAVAFSVAGGLAAIQLLPSLEAVPLSTRGAFGLPETPSISLRGFLRAVGPSPEGGAVVDRWEPRSGLGPAWLALAAAAPVLTRGTRRRRVGWALGVAGGLAGFALGGSALFGWLPGARMFRIPARMFLLAAVPIAWLGGVATQAVLDRPDPETRRRACRAARRAAVVLAGWIAVAAIAAGIGRFRPGFDWLALAVGLPALVGLVGVDPGRAGLGWRVAWVAVLGLDLVAQTRPALRTADLGPILAPSAAARTVARQARPLDRVLDRGLPDHPSSTPLGPAVATRLGLASVRGYNALDILAYKRYLALVSAPEVVRHPYNGLANGPIRHKPPLDLLGVRFLVEPADPALRSAPGEPDPDLAPGWRKVAIDPAPVAYTFAAGGVRTLPAYEVLENLDAMPRAFVVPRVAPLPLDPSEGAAALLGLDPRRLALVESPGPVDVGPGDLAYHAATVASYRPNRVDVEARGPGLLVLADPWYPGWVASVDGVAAPIVRADGLFRGVALSAGPHEVSFIFRPASYRIGRTISLTTAGLVALLTAVAAIGSAVRRRRAGNLDHPIDIATDACSQS